MFSLKAHRAATQRSDLAAVGPAVAKFLGSGLIELGDRLGAINWQLLPTRRFDRDVVAAFLDLLPPALDGVTLRHAVEAAHPSFASPEAIALLRERGIARVIVETPDAPPHDGLTASFVYARLKANALGASEGYDSAALDRWRDRLQAWTSTAVPHDCYVYFIAGDKVRAPDSARALLARLSDRPHGLRPVSQETPEAG